MNHMTRLSQSHRLRSLSGRAEALPEVPTQVPRISSDMHRQRSIHVHRSLVAGHRWPRNDEHCDSLVSLRAHTGARGAEEAALGAAERGHDDGRAECAVVDVLRALACPVERACQSGMTLPRSTGRSSIARARYRIASGESKQWAGGGKLRAELTVIRKVRCRKGRLRSSRSWL
ncbi:hypothetical protein OBBRIDRAFT_281937 [Obba rivulosa]|uniref:Uncharacterized protein n=1 Tax=Obba rivulosa TaxID=1052685 RepID=A0A8E2AUX7_9APHY|nr:hypothetical protein OBBRIDRAFT_281937 [Obba rivulosa]